MTPDQVRVIFERVAYQMVMAGWLKGYAFTAGVGHELTWRTEGAQKAMLLKDLSDRFRLAENDLAPLYFQMACKGMKLPDGFFFTHLDIETTAFWMLCVGELKIDGDGDALLGMVHLVNGWGPEAATSRLEHY